MLNRNEVVPFIMDLFAKRGAQAYMGEPVNMAQHMQQTAAAAVADKADDALIAAALLHDIGHFVGGFPIDSLAKGIDNRHENLAAQFLAPYFTAAVTEPIRLHVAAKKYLYTVDAHYPKQLSSASLQSLAVQGGAMTAQEVAAFEREPYYLAAVRLRKYDDSGKTAHATPPTFTHYRPLLDSLLLCPA